MNTPYIRRYDDDGIMFYFSASDFDGLLTEPISFPGGNGDTLRGAVYGYPGADTSSLVILAHGYGGGHRSYMREIELLCRHGYPVLSYDVTGTFSSDGDSIGGITAFPADLAACIAFVKKKYKAAMPRLLLFGHSLGGYAAAYALSLFPDIDAAVISAGFTTLRDFLTVLRARGEVPSPEDAEKAENACHAGILDRPVTDILASTKARVLWLHSTDDTTSPYEQGAGFLSSRIVSPNVTFLTVSGKQHCPHYSTDAVTCMGDFFSGYGSLIAAGKLPTPDACRTFVRSADFWRMTGQDTGIWQKIIALFR